MVNSKVNMKLFARVATKSYRPTWYSLLTIQSHLKKGSEYMESDPQLISSLMSKKSATKQELQSLVGKLQHTTKVC